MKRTMDTYSVTVVTQEYDGKVTGAEAVGSRRNYVDPSLNETFRPVSAMTTRSPEDRDNPDAAANIAAGRALQRLGKQLERRGLKTIDSAAAQRKAKAAPAPLALGDRVISRALPLLRADKDWWPSRAASHVYSERCQQNDRDGRYQHKRVA